MKDSDFYIDDKEKVASVLEEIEEIKKKTPFSSFDAQAIADLEQSIIDMKKVEKTWKEEEDRVEYNKKILDDRMSSTGEDMFTAMENVRHLFIKKNG